MTVEHLKRLEKIAKQDRQEMFAKNPRLAVYRDRMLLVALCQGAALHYVDGKNGVKDIDVYTFYSAVPGVMLTPRRNVPADFGESEFGYWSREEPIKGERYVGRRVDLLQRSLKVPPDIDPVEAVRTWLQTNGGTPKRLRQEAVVGIWPRKYLGKVIWPIDRIV
ncbi:hypothetical protein [Mycobacterium sp. HNNTM2301]|uniref:hypothetical protein n=1 Tax=Mycobacterium hainanense TaxID=3289775 RepID=UPI0035A6550B